MKFTDKEIADSLKNVVNFYNQYKRKPNTVNINQQTLKWADYGQIKQIHDKQITIDQFRKENCRDPAYVLITGLQIQYPVWKILFEQHLVIKNDGGDAVFNYFCEVFGKVGTIDEALKKIKDRGYEYYYDDRDSNKLVIDRIKARKGVNCVDSAQMMWHVAKALSYDVRCVHVQCKCGGHVRLQLRHPVHTEGAWIDRDPACVLSNNGKPVNAIWCAGGHVIDINPSWFMETLNK